MAPAVLKTQNAPIKTEKLFAEFSCFAVCIKELRGGGGQGEAGGARDRSLQSLARNNNFALRTKA